MANSAQFQTMLEKVILPFWKNLRDDRYGGFYGEVDFDLNLNKTAEKGCILNSRILWFFSTAATALNRKDLLPYAEHAFKFLTEKCMDKEFGGIYWSLNYDGTVKDSTKHTYNQAFAIYALSAYYTATEDETALNLAYEIFNFIESKCKDDKGYGEAYSRELLPESNDKLSENGIIAQRTMNTVLHILEGYSGLFEASPSEAVRLKLRDILQVFLEKVYNSKEKRLDVFFDEDMNSLIDLQSYGHDIEASWLLDWAADLVNEKTLTASVKAMTSTLAESVYERAYRGHSLLNECENGNYDTTRVWWVQAEAVVGFMNAYSKDQLNIRYKNAAFEIMEYIETYFLDKRKGSEWFWELDENMEPTNKKPIVEPWKCPYHNGRMCIEMIRRIK